MAFESWHLAELKAKKAFDDNQEILDEILDEKVNEADLKFLTERKRNEFSAKNSVKDAKDPPLVNDLFGRGKATF